MDSVMASVETNSIKFLPMVLNAIPVTGLLLS